ncbi:iron complex transport system substrate-binding protein [Austwickia chelonae]|uniref:Putative ABC transporter substrate-binding protein n=1 Tax=Austwickia chelonae NBRC 105200 TaxID=1184607 RepID=K6VP14_9MICO|nr:ABC transporter substrate-binding protein [Austwickia chelonae]GAB78469.1 putative ABC transporter substrate-binding protein [Austwickia chelonae NBRC 105200]SEW39878.1 iron complex transport system substrate-binding protein [Austwickia chelonae]
MRHHPAPRQPQLRTATTILLTVALAVGAAGCAASSTTKDAGQGRSAAAGSKDTAYPLTLSTFDFQHRKKEITVKETPKKVLVEGHNNIEIMLALGLADKIATAAPTSAPVREDLAEKWAGVKKAQAFPSKEEAIALRPDLILGWYGAFQEKKWGDVGFWHDRGINTYMSLNSYAQGPKVPQKVDFEYEDILNIGKIFDKQREAEKIVADMKGALDQVKKTQEKEPTRQGVAVLEAVSGQFRVYGKTSLAGSIAASAGVKLAVGESDDKKQVGAEQLIEADPEHIFMVFYGADADAATKAVNTVLEDPALAGLQAVKAKKVHPVALSSIYCSGLRTKDGIDTFTKALSA